MPKFQPPSNWDETADVVVVGAGYAGFIAAMAAHDVGASVLLLEKAEDPGGISICSAGGLRIADDADAALAYLRATNGGSIEDGVLRSLANGMTEIPVQIEEFAQACGAEVGRRKSPGNYPLPGYETFGFVYVDAVPDFEPEIAYPHVRGSPAGARLFRVLEANLEQRGIEVHTSTAAQRLFADDSGNVVGLLTEGPSGSKTVKAGRGVVLACGGFEGDARMQQEYWQARPVLSAAYRANTGDGIRMAQDLGAALWHMWHYHGSYGFKHPDPAYPFAIRTKRVPDWVPGKGPPGDVLMPWILLDRSGRRFMNEYEPYLQDTGARPFDRYLPERQEFAALPAWLVADEKGRQAYSFGRPTYNERGVTFSWSTDNLREVEIGILGRAGDLPELARALDVEESGLNESISRWNAACRNGRDGDHGRPPASMTPIAEPPFYYARIWPVVSNTQGGPVHDAEQRIIDVFGEPIPRLYSAGELGSAFGFLYMSGGNLAECLIGGRIAGRNAAVQPAM
jgi:succinate dehydrogenase/fumarate reductase flavoprotein subunit